MNIPTSVPPGTEEPSLPTHGEGPARAGVGIQSDFLHAVHELREIARDQWGSIGAKEAQAILAQLGDKADRPAETGSDALDAERWRALVGCARITAMGCAGLNNPLPLDYAHLTLNFWTVHPEPSHEIAVEWLNKFVDIAVHIRREKARRGA